MNMRWTQISRHFLVLYSLSALGCGRGQEETIPLPEPTRTASVPAAQPRPSPAALPTAATHPEEPRTIRIEIVFPGLPVAPPTPPLPGTTPSTPALQPGSNTTTPTPAPTPTADSRVIVYGTAWCMPCRNLRTALDARAIPFAYVDVENQKALATPAGRRISEMPSHLRGAVPVTRVVRPTGATTWVQGNDANGVERAYRSVQ